MNLRVPCLRPRRHVLGEAPSAAPDGAVLWRVHEFQALAGVLI